MAYKRNPMRAERMTGLARFVIELEGNAWHTASEQWLERTLDDSANRRLVLPEAFLASDAILVLATNVAAGLEVREAVIARHVAVQLPFLATERLLMRGVKAGGDRQRLHDVIRTHSLAVAQAIAEQGVANDLLERLARDPAFKALHVALAPGELDPAAYVGRAPRQVDDFLERVLPGVLAESGPGFRPCPDHPPPGRGGGMLFGRTTRVPSEWVGGGYTPGSAGGKYKKKGPPGGGPPPAGRVEGARLDPPIFSPATKA